MKTGFRVEQKLQLFNQTIANFFPKKVNLNVGEASSRDDYKSENILYHLGNNDWLAGFIRDRYSSSLGFLSEDYIKACMAGSDLFIQKKCEYELKIVKAQIEYILNQLRDISDIDSYEIFFMKRLSDDSSALEIPMNIVINGIRENTVWIDTLSEMEFNSVYKEIPVDPDIRTNWLNARKLAYCQKYGIDPDTTSLADQFQEEFKKRS